MGVDPGAAVISRRLSERLLGLAAAVVICGVVGLR